MEQLREFDIYVELIDVQTLLPFDLNHLIVDSVKKTGRVVFFDEDVPGGATAFMMQKVLEEQKAYFYPGFRTYYHHCPGTPSGVQF